MMRYALPTILAAALLGCALPACAQQASIAPERPSGPLFLRSYEPVTVPPARLSDSPRLQELIRSGLLYLTVEDAVALAIENNIDVEVSRYSLPVAEWNLERALAGGALPGVPSNASQAGAVAAGQGVAGSQAAAGVSNAGTGRNAGQTANATISQIGPVTQTLDPIFQEASTFSHTSVPQPNVVQSVTPVLISNTRAHNASLQQGLLSGGSVTVSFSDNYLQENAPTDVLNPSSAPNLSVSAQHNLLRGFGRSVNGRTITVSRMNVHTSELNFRTRVSAVVTQVLMLYYGLVAAAEDMRARANAVEVARQFSTDIRREVELGNAAPIEITSADAQLANTQQAYADSQAAFGQREVQLKNMLSRNGIGDPALASADIVALSSIVIPPQDDLPQVADMVAQALANRPDLAAERANLEAAEVSALGTRNGILPSLATFASASSAGLSGTPRTVVSFQGTETADPYFAGGIGNALGQVFRRNFPSERAGAFFQAPVHNWQAQADYAIDQLSLRQTQLTTRKDLNQVEVAVTNYVVALQQARARHTAAVQNRILQEKLFTAEQHKYSLGASTPYNVVQAHRDAIAAQSAEVAARAAYANARVALDQALGRTLEANHIAIAEARSGGVERQSALPAALPRP